MGTRILALVVAALAAAVVAGAAQAATAPPPTLTGELLRSVDNPEFPGAGGTSEVTRQCNADGTGTITYRVTGIATGPYPGTFEETGTIRLGAPLTSEPGQPATFTVTHFQAEFTIDSATGDVVGRKSLAPDGESSGNCTEVNASALIAARYDATITTDSGTYRDEGNTLVGLSDFPIVTEFNETFQSDREAVRPADKEQCKKGGHEALGYRNQGQCVSDVESSRRG